MAKLKKTIEISNIEEILSRKNQAEMLKFCIKYSAEYKKLTKLFDTCKDGLKAKTPDRVGEYIYSGYTIRVSKQPEKKTKAYIQKSVYFD